MSKCPGCGVCAVLANSWHVARKDALYPVTIVTARYQGTYEGGKWLAFPFDPETVGNSDYAASDVECLTFFQSHDYIPIGRGRTPEEAFDNLKMWLEGNEFGAWAISVRSRED